MRIPSKSDQTETIPEDLPTEVKIWVDRGWTIIPSERRGYVLSGQKAMRGLDKAGIFFGVLLVAAFFFGQVLFGLFGLVLILASWLDFKFNTKAPTKFFPEPGERVRVMERR